MKLPGHRIAAIALAMVVMLIDASAGLAQSSGRPIVATTPHFAFYSDFPTNLSDALIAAGSARHGIVRSTTMPRSSRPASVS